MNNSVVVLNGLTAAEVVSIAKGLKKKKIDDSSFALSPGEYEIDFLVHVKGTITKGEDYKERIVAKANPWALLAVAFSKLNSVTVDSLVKEADVIAQGDVEEIKARANKAVENIKDSTLSDCLGKVTTNLQFTAVVN